MKVSVIVPVHNGEEWVEECVKSLVAQTLHDFEVVVVDDGSTDGSIAAFKDAFSGCGRRDISVVYTDTATGPVGIARARRQGLQQAHGEYIGFLDADDCYNPRALELMLDAAGRTDAAVTCGVMELFDDGSPEQVTFRHGYPPKLTAVDMLRRMLTLEQRGYSGSMNDKLFHRGVLYAVKEWSEGGIQEDCATMAQILLTGPRIATVPHAVYRYRQRQGSTADMTTLTPERLLEQLRTLEANVGIVGRNIKASPLAEELQKELIQYRWAAKMSRAHFIKPMIKKAARSGSHSEQIAAWECKRQWERMFPGLLPDVLFHSRLSLHQRLALLRRTFEIIFG